MFCEGAGSDVEAAYLANLAEVASFTATAEQLSLFDASGAAILEFAASEPAELSGTEWHATGINNGNEAVESIVAGTDPTAMFDEATGTISGNATCNTYNGPAAVDGTAVTIGPLMSTKMACADDAANRQEANFLVALEAATTWEVSGTTLELRDDSGALQVSFESR
jgi:heat shock protein HslJ